jgi:alkanesulfonate monooxygenase SsuD/methylene tetrahydromethanopterin reductase-like flavin-dependent oxidoreductase (luciferase family)
MRLGLNLGYSGAGMALNVELVKRAEALGFDSVWSAEAYGSDAVSPLAFMAALTSKIKLGTAIMQMPARTPAMTAMTAMTLDQLSGGRFILGLGPSGPQVVEGWHGVPYGKPLERTREYIDVVRQILAREKPVEVKKEGRGYALYIRLPFAEKEKIQVWTRGEELVVQVANQRRHVLLPRTLASRRLLGAAFEDQRLRVAFGEKEAHGTS